MNLKARIEKIEAKLDLLDTTDDLDDRFPGWTEGELINYAINGIKPEGKSFGHISDRAYTDSLCERFRDWTDEELERYVLTGEKPEAKRS